MTITTDHSASSYGVPVILDDDGNLMDYGDGIKAIREKLEFSAQLLGDQIGVSARTIEGWEQGRMPNTKALYNLAEFLDRWNGQSEVR